jgi:hypothetical protein
MKSSNARSLRRVASRSPRSMCRRMSNASFLLAPGEEAADRVGTMVPGSMGMNTPFNFQLDGTNAAINGDFMLRPAELNPVIKALRANGIEVASIHNHLLDNEPTLVFMHFWAYGDAVNLAKGLKAALMRIGG